MLTHRFISNSRPRPILLLQSTLAPWRDILKIHQYRVPPPFDFPERSYHKHLIIMRLGCRGTVECNIEGKTSNEVFYPSELSFIACGHPYFARSNDESEALVLTLDPKFVSNVAHSQIEDGVELISRKHFKDPQLEHLLLALRSEVMANCPTGRLFGELMASAVSMRLLQCCSPSTFKEITHPGALSPLLLSRVVDYLQSHLDEDLTLRRLSDVLQMSPYHFARAFKQSTGLSPHQYLLEQRVERAKTMLEGNRQSIAEIAYLLGFPSQSHFTVIFRKTAGLTPGAYRKLIKL
jgi:AraC family transcriptional regulator